MPPNSVIGMPARFLQTSEMPAADAAQKRASRPL
jgi:hypothetical protein